MARIVTTDNTCRVMKETMKTVSIQGKDYPAVEFVLCVTLMKEDKLTGNTWPEQTLTKFTTILDPNMHKRAVRE